MPVPLGERRQRRQQPDELLVGPRLRPAVRDAPGAAAAEADEVARRADWKPPEGRLRVGEDARAIDIGPDAAEGGAGQEDVAAAHGQRRRRRTLALRLEFGLRRVRHQEIGDPIDQVVGAGGLQLGGARERRHDAEGREQPPRDRRRGRRRPARRGAAAASATPARVEAGPRQERASIERRPAGRRENGMRACYRLTRRSRPATASSPRRATPRAARRSDRPTPPAAPGSRWRPAPRCPGSPPP